MSTVISASSVACGCAGGCANAAQVRYTYDCYARDKTLYRLQDE